MSKQGSYLDEVLTLDGRSESTNLEQQTKFSHSMISTEDGNLLDELHDIPESGHVNAASTPVKKADLLTGENLTPIKSDQGDQILNPYLSSAQSSKRKRADPPSTAPLPKPIRFNDSEESLKQDTKRANNGITGSDSSQVIEGSTITGLDDNTVLRVPSNVVGDSEGGTNCEVPSSAAVTEELNEYIVFDGTDLAWRSSDSSPLYSNLSSPPFTVFVESTIAGRNLGKLDPIQVIDLLTPLISGNKQVSRSGINQIRVECERYQSANDLVNSDTLRSRGYRMFIPDSFIHKRGFTDWFPPRRSIKDIIRVATPEELKSISGVRRLVRDPNIITDRVEFSFSSPTVPRFITIGGFLFQITPVIQKPRRCYRCQRFCHTMNQCRSTYPSCEHCSGRHQSNLCPYKELTPCCKNCKRDHPSSSNLCPIFKMEFGILKIRYSTNCGRTEAKKMFLMENPDLERAIQSRDDSLEELPSPGCSNELHSSPLKNPKEPILQKEMESVPTPSQQGIGGAPDFGSVFPQSSSEGLSAVDALISLNKSNSELIGSLQENLASPTSQIRALEEEIKELLNH